MDQDQNKTTQGGAETREMSPERLARARDVFVKQLAQDFRDEITGEKTGELVGENPENRFLVGKILPRSDRSDRKDDGTTSFVFIESIGLDFYLKREGIEDAEITVIPRGEFYYRCYPTLKQQLDLIISRICLYTKSPPKGGLFSILGQKEDNPMSKDEYYALLKAAHERTDWHDRDSVHAYNEYARELRRQMAEKEG